jgi:hypothetical protein
MQDAFRLYGEYRIMRNVAGYSIFRGRVESRKGEDEFMRSIEASRPRSTSDSASSSATYDFIESGDTRVASRPP